MIDKKGQIASLQGVIFTVVLVGILISAGFFILQEFYEQPEFVDTSGTVTNETGAHLNSTTYTVAKASSQPGFNGFVLTGARNGTTGSTQTIALGNFTQDASAGTITNATATTWSDVDLDYTYKYGGQAYLGVNDTLSTLTTVPNLLGLIILIAVIGIILAVVFNVIPGAKMSGA